MRETFQLKTPQTLFPWTSQLVTQIAVYEVVPAGDLRPGNCVTCSRLRKIEVGRSWGLKKCCCSLSSGPAGSADEKVEGRER